MYSTIVFVSLISVAIYTFNKLHILNILKIVLRYVEPKSPGLGKWGCDVKKVLVLRCTSLYRVMHAMQCATIGLIR